MTVVFSENVLEMANVLGDKKAEDILIINVGKSTIVAEYFIICTGYAVNHVKMLADELDAAMAKKGMAKLRIEGYSPGRWIVLDYGDILVHIFHKEERDFYNIERLWKGDNNCFHYSAMSKTEAEK